MNSCDIVTGDGWYWIFRVDYNDEPRRICLR